MIYGVLENAIYGGRIDNVFDLKVLNCYMRQMFTEQTLGGRAKLSDLLTLPQSGAAKDYNQLIHQTPEIDTPALFGLPNNIDRSVQRFNSQTVISQLKSLAAVSAEQLRFDKEKWA